MMKVQVALLHASHSLPQHRRPAFLVTDCRQSFMSLSGHPFRSIKYAMHCRTQISYGIFRANRRTPFCCFLAKHRFVHNGPVGVGQSQLTASDFIWNARPAGSKLPETPLSHQIANINNVPAVKQQQVQAGERLQNRKEHSATSPFKPDAVIAKSSKGPRGLTKKPQGKMPLRISEYYKKFPLLAQQQGQVGESLACSNEREDRSQTFSATLPLSVSLSQPVLSKLGEDLNMQVAIPNKKTAILTSEYYTRDERLGKSVVRQLNDSRSQSDAAFDALSSQYDVMNIEPSKRFSSHGSMTEKSIQTGFQHQRKEREVLVREFKEIRGKSNSFVRRDVIADEDKSHTQYLHGLKCITYQDDMGFVESGDDWARKRVGWLCKELPVLNTSELVKLLNRQRKWIKQEHINEIIEHLVRLMELNRAHQVLNWMQQQPSYRFEYELLNNLAYILGRNDKVLRCQNIFDEIIRNGRTPEPSTFTVLIKAYIHQCEDGDIDNAWNLFKQMVQLKLKTSSKLLEILFKAVTCPTGRWLLQAEELLEHMKSSGRHHVNGEMYTRLLEIYGKQGNHNKVEALIQEMKEENLELDLKVMNSRLAACAKNGDVRKCEVTFRDMTELGIKPDWRTYVHLIKTYGAAKMPLQSWTIYNKMKGNGVPLNIATYHSIINAMANALHTDHVLELLSEVEKTDLKPLQPCFDSAMNMYLQLKCYKEVESLFDRAKAANVRPAHATFNMLIKAYINSGQMEKAECVYQEMKQTGGIGANSLTYNLMLEAYGVACLKDKVQEVLKEMLARGCLVDSNVKVHIQSMIGVNKLVSEKEKLKLTMEHREILPGLLLGGAKLVSPDNDQTYELHLQFDCKKQVASVLKDHISSLFLSWWKKSSEQNKCEAEENLEEKSDKLVGLETVSHGSLRFYANQYRPQGVPVVPRLIHRWLTPRTLAYWYMYGGHKCDRTGGIVLKASKYSAKQLQLVMKALKARAMDCWRTYDGHQVRFQGKSASKIWMFMEPHILPELKEELKPEEVPVNLGFAGNQVSEQKTSAESSDAEDWECLLSDQSEEVCYS